MDRSFARVAAAGVIGVTFVAAGNPAAAVTVARPNAVCVAPSSPAAFAQPIYSDRPAVAAAEGLSGKTTVKLRLAADGTVTSAEVLGTSGASVLDAAALRIVREARYIPEIANCAHVPGVYTADVEFSN